MQWNNSFSESVHTFANTINTHEGGTHEEGFRAALTNTVNNFAEAQNLIKKKEDRLTGDLLIRMTRWDGVTSGTGRKVDGSVHLYRVGQ